MRRVARVGVVAQRLRTLAAAGARTGPGGGRRVVHSALAVLTTAALTVGTAEPAAAAGTRAVRWQKTAPYTTPDSGHHCSLDTYPSLMVNHDWACTHAEQLALRTGDFMLTQAGEGHSGSSEGWIRIYESHELTRPTRRVDYTATVQVDEATAEVFLDRGNGVWADADLFGAAVPPIGCGCDFLREGPTVISVSAWDGGTVATATPLRDVTITFSFSIATFDGSALPSPISVEVGASADAGAYVAKPPGTAGLLDTTPPAANRAGVHVAGQILEISAKARPA